MAEEPLFLAREPRSTATVMAVAALIGLAIATVMWREDARTVLVLGVGGFALLVLLGSLRMLVRPRDELRVDTEGVTFRDRPTIAWTDLGGASVELDSEGDPRLVLFVADPWWEGQGRLYRRAAGRERDDAGRRRLVLSSMALSSRHATWLDVIEEGRARYAEPTWPTE